MLNFIRKYADQIAACAIAALVLYLFYRSFYVLILVIPFFFVYRNISKKEKMKMYKEKLSLQFKDALLSLAAALRAGYSIENAIKESAEEMRMMYGENAPICLELQKMINRMNLGISAEKLFFELAKTTQVEDIETFASVFIIAKKSGGDMVEIIHNTASDIAQKVDTKNEIAVLIASKRFEQKIMNLVPLGIIVYVSLTSGELLENLYGNPAGIIIMSLCLALYCFALLLSKKIIDIQI